MNSSPNPNTDANAAGASFETPHNALSVRHSGVLQSPQPQLLPPSYTEDRDSLAGGIDYRRAWHAFRRRWLPAVVLGMTLAVLAAVGAWFFLPKGYEAVAWLRVRDKSGMLSGGGRDAAEYEAYRKTQVQLIKSPFVLTAALRRPSISDLGMLRDEIDPVSWLAHCSYGIGGCPGAAAR